MELKEKYPLLSQMEIQVVELKKRGLSFREIGEKLGIDQKTAWTYYSRAESKRDKACQTCHNFRKLNNVDIVFPQETSESLIHDYKVSETPSGTYYNLEGVYMERGGDSPNIEFRIEGNLPFGILSKLDDRMVKYKVFEMHLKSREHEYEKSIGVHKVALKSRKIRTDGWFVIGLIKTDLEK